MNTDVFFTEQGMKQIESGQHTVRSLYKWTHGTIRKARKYRSSNPRRYFRLMGTVNQFSGKAESFFVGSLNETCFHTVHSLYGDKLDRHSKGWASQAIKRQYAGIKAGLRTMEQRAEDAINMGLCWMCGEELVDKRLDECYRCRCNDECPTCHGDCVVGTGRYIRSWDWLEPPEELEKTCPDCNGRGDFDSYLEVNGVEAGQ